jgi:glutamine synthetase
MFEKFDVFNRTELESRAEIKYENYSKIINIEARAMIDIASKHIIPAVISYVTTLANSINQIKQACSYATVDVQEELLLEASDWLATTKNALKTLERLMACVPEKEKGRERAYYFMEEVVPAMEALRKPVDKLEMIVDKNVWPMPSYGDLLFEV